MIQFLILALCTAQVFALSLPQDTPLTEQELVLARQNHPGLFSGEKTIPTDVALELSTAARRATKSFGQVMNVYFGQKLPKTKQYLIDSISSALPGLRPDQAERMRGVLTMIESQAEHELGGIDTFFGFVRAAIALSHGSVSPEERDFFGNGIGDKEFFIFQRDGFANLPIAVVLEQLKSKDPSLPVNIRLNRTSTKTDDPNLSPKFKNDTKRIINSHYATILLPVFGVGHFGFFTILWYQTLGVNLAGIPLKKTKGHSSNLSPLGFPLHDALHHEDEAMHETLWENVFYHVNKAGIDNAAFRDAYVHIAVQKLRNFNMGVRLILNTIIGRILPHYGEAVANKAFIGLFMMRHEYPKLYAHDLDSSDFAGVINNLAERAKEAGSDLFSWDSEENPFETSPIDGTTLKADEEILEWFRSTRFSKEPAFTKMFVHEGEKLKFDTLETKVERSPYFITSTFKLKKRIITHDVSGNNIHDYSSDNYRYSMPTLKFKMDNLSDHTHWLKMAGLAVAPTPEGLDARQTAMFRIKAVRAQIDTCIDFAAHIANLVGASPFGEDYMRWHMGTNTSERKCLPRP